MSGLAMTQMIQPRQTTSIQEPLGAGPSQKTQEPHAERPGGQPLGGARRPSEVTTLSLAARAPSEKTEAMRATEGRPRRGRRLVQGLFVGQGGRTRRTVE